MGKVGEKRHAVGHHGMSRNVEKEERGDIVGEVGLACARFGMNTLVDPYDLRGACNGMRRRTTVQLERTTSLVYDLALCHRRCRALTGRPSVLAVDGTCYHDRRLERFGKEAGRRDVIGDEGIGTPREFEGVGDSISVGVGEIWRSPVDASLHLVWKSVPV